MSKTITDVKIKTYKAVPDENIRARAIIGNGQKGGWAMLLNDQHIKGGTASQWVPLGVAQDLVGKALEVSAVMMDVQANTNKLSLGVEVEGDADLRVAISHVGGDGDSAAYSIFVKFEKKVP